MSRLRACYQNGINDQSLWLASIATYWDMLSEYEADDIRAAFSVAWRRCPDWMPSAGQLARLIEGGSSSTADQAWPEVLELARHSSGEHSDPVARECIRLMGGGSRLGQMRSDELHVWAKKEFCELYAQVAGRAENQRAYAALKAAELPRPVAELVADVVSRTSP